MDLFDLAIAKKLSGGGGGGGSGIATLLATKDMGHLQTTSSSDVDTGVSVDVDLTGYDMLLAIAVNSERKSGYHFASGILSSVYGSPRTKANRSFSTTGGMVIKGTSSGFDSATLAYGVAGRISAIDGNIATVNVYIRANSSTGTVNGDYTLYLYGINLLQGII